MLEITILTASKSVVIYGINVCVSEKRHVHLSLCVREIAHLYLVLTATTGVELEGGKGRHLMTKGRDNLAETLNDVLELVRVRRQTGLLSIEHLRDGRYEEGEVYVQAGWPVYAQLGQLSGQEALVRLLNWRQIYFAFFPEAARPTANIATASGVNGAPAASSSISTLTPPRFPAVSGNTSSRTAEASAREGRSTPVQSVPQLESGTPGLEWLVPRKIGDHDVMALPLTRPQRSMYLLIDGRRSIADIARCTRKSMQEVERLLSELRERGLIGI